MNQNLPAAGIEKTWLRQVFCVEALFLASFSLGNAGRIPENRPEGPELRPELRKAKEILIIISLFYQAAYDKMNCGIFSWRYWEDE